MAEKKKNKSARKKKKIIISAVCVAGAAAVIAGIGFVCVSGKSSDGDKNKNSNTSASESSDETQAATAKMVETSTIVYTPNEAIDCEFETPKAICNVKTVTLDKSYMCLEYELENIYVRDIPYEELSIVVFSGTDCQSVKATNEVVDNNADADEEQVIRSGDTVTVKASAEIEEGGTYDVVIINEDDTTILKNKASVDAALQQDAVEDTEDTETEPDSEGEENEESSEKSSEEGSSEE